MPLEADDVFYPDRVTYLYRENSQYNRRFEQRRRLKELLGKDYRRLVSDAIGTHGTKGLFLDRLTSDQAAAIRRIVGVEPGEFWRACRGRIFLSLPRRPVQLELDFGDEEHTGDTAHVPARRP